MRLRFPLLFLALCCVGATAQQMRKLEPIPTPEISPSGSTPAEIISPVSARSAEKAAMAIVEAWNDRELGGVLSDDFNDRQRLLDSMDEDVPLDASVRVLSFRSPQTLQQFMGKTDDGAPQITSIVSVTAQTQIEFNDPERGRRHLRGNNNLILKVTEALRP